MTDEPSNDGAFELEPEDNRPLRIPSVPDGPPLRDEREGPDERTLAERKGVAIPTSPDEALPPPPDWPREAFAFPLRRPGPSFFAGVGGAFVIADLLRGVPALTFVGMVLVLLVWICALRAQAAIIGQSAAGKDAPVGWDRAMQLETRDLAPLAWILVFFGLAFFGPLLLDHLFETRKGVLFAAALSPYLAVVMLGWATGDKTLKWPWKALEWLARRPLAFAAGALGWWALWYGESLILSTPFPALVIVSPIVRICSLYVLLVSARAIGVAGRSWTPFGFQEAEPPPD